MFPRPPNLACTLLVSQVMCIYAYAMYELGFSPAGFVGLRYTGDLQDNNSVINLTVFLRDHIVRYCLDVRVCMFLRYTMVTQIIHTKKGWLKKKRIGPAGAWRGSMASAIQIPGRPLDSMRARGHLTHLPSCRCAV